MDKQLKDKWIAALRSGKYAQGKQFLNRKNNFCCLGVLCEVANLKRFDNGAMVFYDYENMSQAELPPYNFLESVGLNACVDKGSERAVDRLARMNDYSNFSFDQIADWIEVNV